MLRRSLIHSSAVAASTVAASASPSSRGAGGSPFDSNAIGLTTDSEHASFLIAFSKQYRHTVSDAFIPAKAMLRQCRYTAGLHSQLTQLAQRARIEKFVSADCIDDSTKDIIASRLIVSTAFNDRITQGHGSKKHKAIVAGGGGGGSGSKPLSSSLAGGGGGGSATMQTKQERNRELLAHTRRLAVEHFNWCYYWRSLAFDAQDEAMEEFCRIVVAGSSSSKPQHPQDLSFFLTQKEQDDLALLTSSGAVNQESVEKQKGQKIEDAIKKQLKEYATEGGAVSQGGSWTWLVWNPFSGTSFSASNRYGLKEETTTTTSTTAATPAEASSPPPAQTDKTSAKNIEKGDESATAAAKKSEDAKPTPTAASATATATAAATAPETSSATKTTTTTTTTTVSIPVAGRLEVINTPYDVCPLELGLFPILCINMTERATLASPLEWSTVPIADAHFHENQIPAWSRAARNSAALKARAADIRKPGYQAFESAEKQRERFVAGVINHLNWTSAVKQLAKALEWNNSKQRRDQMLKHATEIRKRAERRAQDVLDRKIDGGAASSSSSTSASAALDEHGVTEEAAIESKTSTSTSQEAVIEQEEKEAPAAVAETQQPQQEKPKQREAEHESVRNVEPQDTSAQEANLTPTVNEQGDLIFNLPDGTVKFKHPDGRLTITFPDGKTEWWSAPDDFSEENQDMKFSAQFSNGDTEYHYRSGMVTKVAQDGTTVTYNPDGSVYTPEG